MFSSLRFFILLLLLCDPFVAGSSTVLVTSTIVVTESVPSPSSPSSYESNSQFRHDILNSTNTFRAQHNATELSWSERLAEYARRWAETCEWEHSDGPYGENLAAGYLNVTAAVEAWGNERSEYDFSNQGFQKSTGHFTQLVWKDTDAMGCGRARCEGDEVSGWYVVCEYHPPGNVLDEFEANVQAQMASRAGHGMRRHHGLKAVVMALLVIVAVSRHGSLLDL